MSRMIAVNSDSTHDEDWRVRIVVVLRGTHVLHIFRVPDQTESLRNRYLARSRNPVGWMDGALSSSVPSDSVDNGRTAPPRPCEQVARVGSV